MADPTTELLNFTVGNTPYTLNVPPVVLGAALGALIASFTAWLNNRYLRVQFADRVSHEREQAKLERDHRRGQAQVDRELNLRREVYLRATVWATDAVRQLGFFVNPEAAINFQPASADAPGSVLLVGSGETVRLCFKLQCIALEIIGEFALRRAELEGPHRRMLKFRELTSSHLAGLQVENIDGIVAEQDALLSTHIPALEAFTVDIAVHLERVIELAAEFQISMSKDLGFTPDEEAIRLAMREYNKVGRSSVVGIFERLRDLAGLGGEKPSEPTKTSSVSTG